MNYPSLSLKQDLIDKVFSGTIYGIPRQNEKTPSLGAIRMRKISKIQKELRLQNAVVAEECDQCEFKTSKYLAMYRHKRENHSVRKQSCTDCEYSNIYPNRVKMHVNQVHRGIKKRNKKWWREWCEFSGTKNCLELLSHSMFVCKKCQLSFGRSDSLNDKW